MNLDEFEEIPDKTYSDLMEDAEEDDESPDWVKAEEEFEEQAEEFYRLIQIHSTGILLGEMFQENFITLREYFALTEYLEQEERELDMSLL